MKIIKNYRNIDESDRGSIIAIGNFDGIHNGHKALINNIIELSKDQKKYPKFIFTSTSEVYAVSQYHNNIK